MCVWCAGCLLDAGCRAASLLRAAVPPLEAQATILRCSAAAPTDPPSLPCCHIPCTPQAGKCLYTTIRELVENGLDAAEAISVLPDIDVTV